MRDSYHGGRERGREKGRERKREEKGEIEREGERKKIKNDDLERVSQYTTVDWVYESNAKHAWAQRHDKKYAPFFDKFCIYAVFCMNQ